MVVETHGKGSIFSREGSENTQGKYSVLVRKGSGNTRQRHCLQPRRQRKHKAKAVSLSAKAVETHNAKGSGFSHEGRSGCTRQRQCLTSAARPTVAARRLTWWGSAKRRVTVTATPQTRVEGELQPLLLWPSSISDTHAHSNVQWPTGIGAARMRNLSHL